MKYYSIVILFIMFLTGGRLLGDSKKQTVGFEVEYRGDLNPALFSFLEPEVSTEETGNKEVRSKVFTNDVEAEAALNQLIDFLGDKRRSIHIHRRFAKKPNQVLPAAGLASRLSDIVFLWRLERAPKIATTYWSQERRSPSGVTTTKGTVFLQDLGEEWDFETRGIFNDPQFALNISRVFSMVSKNPLKFASLFDTQSALFLRTEGLSEMLRRVSIEKGLGQLSDTQKTKITQLEKSVRYSAILPLYHYEDNPELSLAQRKQIEIANNRFAESVLELISLGAIEESILASRFRDLLSRWAMESDLLQTLITDTNRRLSGESFGQGQSARFLNDRIQKASRSEQARIRSEAKALTDGTGVSAWLERLVHDELRKEKPEKSVMMRLIGVEGPQWNDLVEKMLKHPSKEARLAAAELFFNRAPTKIPLELLKQAIVVETDTQVRQEFSDALTNALRKGVRLQQPNRSTEIPIFQRPRAQMMRQLRQHCFDAFGDLAMRSQH